MRQEEGGEADAAIRAVRMWWSQEEGSHHSALTHRAHPSCSRHLVKRNFTPEAPDRLWVADITYVRTWEGWLYLSFVLDTYSRRIVGWSMANHLKTDLVLDALNMAIYTRRPSPGLIHHSDSQNTGGCERAA